MQDEIVKFLKNHDGYISGEEISRSLKVSRTAVWKYIEELRTSGYEIEAVPHLGYRLTSSPDKLFPHEIQFDLKTQFIGRKIFHYDSVPSTMDAAFRLGMEGEPEGSVVIAEGQLKGKGRLGRTWTSPKGKGIYLSVIFRPAMTATEVSHLTLMSAVAVCEAVNKMSGVKATIKWPNDVLIGTKKLAGILTELHAEVDRVRFCVVGIGLNVNTPLNLLPPHSTSLKHEAGENFSRVELVQEILRSLERWYGRLKENGSAVIISRWTELAQTLGRRVRIVDAHGATEGEAVGLDATGGLMIRNDAGLIVKKMTGDVVVIR